MDAIVFFACKLAINIRQKLNIKSFLYQKFSDPTTYNAIINLIQDCKMRAKSK